MKTYNHFIDGRYAEPISGRWFDSVDPYCGEAWAKIPQGCAQDVDRRIGFSNAFFLPEHPPPSSRTPSHVAAGSGRSPLKTYLGPKVCP